MAQFLSSGLKSEKGVALVSVFAIMVILMAISLGYTFITRTQLEVSNNQTESLKAFYIAEAGIDDALDEVIRDIYWRDGFTNKSFGSGNYTVTLKDDLGYGNKPTGILQISSTGTFGGSTKSSVLQLLLVQPFGYGQQSGGAAAGGMGMVDFSNSTGVINGDIIVSGKVDTGEVIVNGIVEAEVANLPTYTVDYAGYQSIADHVISGDYIFDAAGGPYNGIYYIGGKAIFKNDAVINGSVIAMGAVKTNIASDRFTISPLQNNPAIISATKVDIKNNGAIVNGLVYSSGDLIFEGSSNFQVQGFLVFNNELKGKDCTGLNISYVKSDIGQGTPPFITWSVLKPIKLGWRGYK